MTEPTLQFQAPPEFNSTSAPKVQPEATATTGSAPSPEAELPDWARSELERARNDAAKYRTRAREFADDGEYERAKEALKRVTELEEAQKSEAQKLQDQLAAAQKERDNAAADALRMRVAVKHGVKHDDLDLLGSGSEEEIDARAQRLVSYYPKTLGAPTPGKPVEQLHPGAAPKEEMTPEEETWQKLFGPATTGK